MGSLNEAYSAPLPSRPTRESVGYETTDEEEYSYITNRGEGRGGQRTVRDKSSGHGAYEVMNEEDQQTANPESSTKTWTELRARKVETWMGRTAMLTVRLAETPHKMKITSA